jgi:transposase
MIPSQTRVYLFLGATDMRKSINGLSIMVEDCLKLDPFSGHLFVFCNRRRNIIKILYWNKNGFCLWQKRLEKDRFKWPGNEAEVFLINWKELGWLVAGLDITTAHNRLKYETLI